MFRCHFCQQIAPPKTTRHSVVLEMRSKTYVAQRREAKPRGGFRGRDRDEKPRDRGGEGREIIREVFACPACAEKHKSHEPQVQSPAPAPETTEPNETTES